MSQVCYKENEDSSSVIQLRSGFLNETTNEANLLSLRKPLIGFTELRSIHSQFSHLERFGGVNSCSRFHVIEKDMFTEIERSFLLFL